MTELLEELNRDIWHPFVRAYGDLDVDAMVERHGDRIAIDFRFHERLVAGELASERGMFRLSVTTTGEPRTRYGRFHTFARRVDGRWRFAVDYDTTDGADEAAFAAGAEIDDVARFTA